MFNEDVVNKSIDEYIRQLKYNSNYAPYANPAELKEVFRDFAEIVRQHKDDSLGDIALAILKDVIDEMESLIEQGYAKPGILIGFNSLLGNISIAAGDTKSSGGTPISDKTLFDMASITKLYTGVIAYKLIDAGILDLDQKITDIFESTKTKRFEYLGDVTVRDIMQFSVEFKTPGRLDDAKSVQEAKDILYGTTVVQTGVHQYNDIGMMILKEVMEEVSKKTYAELFEKYITIPLALHDTYLSVPEEKRAFVTGTPNIKPIIEPNDLKAITIGSSGGHAGVFATNLDLLKFIENLCINANYFHLDHFNDLVTPGQPNKDHLAVRGVFGSTYTPHSTGMEKSFIDIKYPRETFAVQGSTRTQAIGGIIRMGRKSLTPVHFATTILMNPGSAVDPISLSEEELQNHQASKLIKKIQFKDSKGNERTLYSVDGRMLVPISKLDDLNKKAAAGVLKISLLGLLIKEYERNYDKKEDISLHRSI